MYNVLVDFVDLKDNNKVYRAGDKYPRTGLKVGEERINELISSGNKLGRPVIEEIMPEPKKRGRKANAN